MKKQHVVKKFHQIVKSPLNKKTIPVTFIYSHGLTYYSFLKCFCNERPLLKSNRCGCSKGYPSLSNFTISLQDNTIIDNWFDIPLTLLSCESSYVRTLLCFWFNIYTIQKVREDQKTVFVQNKLFIIRKRKGNISEN